MAEIDELNKDDFRFTIFAPDRMPFFLDFLMSKGSHHILMFLMEAEQLSEFTGSAEDAFLRLRNFVERYVGLVPQEGEDESGDGSRRLTPFLPQAVRRRLREAVNPIEQQRSIGTVWTISSRNLTEELKNDKQAGLKDRSVRTFVDADLSADTWTSDDESVEGRQDGDAFGGNINYLIGSNSYEKANYEFEVNDLDDADAFAVGGRGAVCAATADVIAEAQSCVMAQLEREWSLLPLAVNALARLSSAALHCSTDDSLREVHQLVGSHIIAPMISVADLKSLPKQRLRHSHENSQLPNYCKSLNIFYGLELPLRRPCLVGLDSRIFAMLDDKMLKPVDQTASGIGTTFLSESLLSFSTYKPRHGKRKEQIDAVISGCAVTDFPVSRFSRRDEKELHNGDRHESELHYLRDARRSIDAHWIWSTGENVKMKSTKSSDERTNDTIVENNMSAHSVCKSTLTGLEDLLAAESERFGRPIVVDLDTDEVFVSMRDVVVESKGRHEDQSGAATMKDTCFLEESGRSVPTISRSVSDEFARALHRIWRQKEHHLASSLLLGRTSPLSDDNDNDDIDSDEKDDREENIQDRDSTGANRRKRNECAQNQRQEKIRPHANASKGSSMSLIANESRAGIATLNLCRRVFLCDLLFPLRRFVVRQRTLGVAVVRRQLCLDAIASADAISSSCNDKVRNQYGAEGTEDPPPPPPPLGRATKNSSGECGEVHSREAVANAASEAKTARIAKRWALLRGFMRTETCASIVENGDIFRLPEAAGNPKHIPAHLVLPTSNATSATY